MNKLIGFFDKLEDRVRFKLSHHPVAYAFISGVGATLFFRGVWIIADQFSFMTGWITLGASLVILLLTGALVGQFLNDRIIMSGVMKDKKLAEKTEKEVREESEMLAVMHKRLIDIEQKVDELVKRTTISIH